MTEIFNVTEKPFSDESIIKKDYHSYTPYVNSFKNNDEIRICIQNQDIFVTPSESYIYIEGSVTVSGGKTTQNARLRSNCLAHMFDEIRYEINGIEIDRTRYLGIASTIKNFVSMTDFESNMIKNAGWNNGEELSIGTFMSLSKCYWDLQKIITKSYYIVNMSLYFLEVQAIAKRAILRFQPKL